MILEHIEAQDNSIKILEESESKLSMGYNTDSSYDEVNKMLSDFEGFMQTEYNTSLAGRMNMGGHGFINFQTWIFESNDFVIELTYINDNKVLIKNHDESYVKGIGENNLMLEIIRK